MYCRRLGHLRASSREPFRTAEVLQQMGYQTEDNRERKTGRKSGMTMGGGFEANDDRGA